MDVNAEHFLFIVFSTLELYISRVAIPFLVLVVINVDEIFDAAIVPDLFLKQALCKFFAHHAAVVLLVFGIEPDLMVLHVSYW